MDKNSELRSRCIFSSYIGEACHFFQKSLVEEEIKNNPELQRAEIITLDSKVVESFIEKLSIAN